MPHIPQLTIANLLNNNIVMEISAFANNCQVMVILVPLYT